MLTRIFVRLAAWLRKTPLERAIDKTPFDKEASAELDCWALILERLQ